jgi:hypothetical protein
MGPSAHVAFCLCRLSSHRNQSPEYQRKPDPYFVWTVDDVLRARICFGVLDRKSLWLPAKLKTLTAFYDFQTLGAPIAGIYLTPVSRDLGYASQISNGEYKKWLPLILPNPKALEDFPLRLVVGVADGQCLFFSDTPRWEAKQ